MSSPGENDHLTVSTTLVRPGESSPEIFWARRRPEREFLGGFHAFFAGGVEWTDDRIQLDCTGDDDRLRAAALRETFEECGLRITAAGIDRFPPGDRGSELLTDPDQPLAASRLELLGWWTTPAWLRPSFSTAFYGVRLTEQEGRVLDDLADELADREFDAGSWLPADEALRRWEEGRVFSTTPLRAIVDSIARLPPDPDRLERPDLLGDSMHNPNTRRMGEVTGGIVMIPLQTPTIPPATHTNSVVFGRRRFVVFDPGTDDENELQTLFDYVGERLDAGDECIGVVATHHHRDHVLGIPATTDRFGVPLLAHQETLNRLEELPAEVSKLEDGDRLDVDHPGPLRAVFTPGHAPGHLAFHQPETDFVVGGDLVASRGTIVVAPPEGHMGDYLDSLQRLKSLDPRALLPSHGQLITDPVSLIDHYLDHRRMREQKVLDALRDAKTAGAGDLVPTVYDDAPKSAWPIARRSLLAHLIHLVERGLATRDHDTFRAV